MVILESDREIVRRIFYMEENKNPALRYVWDYCGKHYLEHYRKEGYMSKEEFKDLMKDMNIHPFKESDLYPLVVKPEYIINWA